METVEGTGTVSYTHLMAFAGIVLVGGCVVIQSIFRISIIDKIKSYGQLRTGGATKKQIMRIVKKEGHSLGWKGMSVSYTHLDVYKRQLLNQATTDRDELASLLNISENQLSYITNVGAGKGLIRCSGNLVPFENSFPKNTKLYRLMTTKPGDVYKRQCPTVRKQIGKTTYIVRVHFSQTAKETMEDKIKRLLREEVRKM